MSPKTNDHTLPPDELGEPRRIVLAAGRKRSPATQSISTVPPKPKPRVPPPSSTVPPPKPTKPAAKPKKPVAKPKKTAAHPAKKKKK